MRALYTAASGLVSQQTKLDVIGNNMANLNTVGYKTQNTEFAELLRSQFTQPDKFKLDGRRSDSGLRIGNGSYAAHLAQTFTQGNMQNTGNQLDLAIEGSGFFAVRVPGQDANGNPITAFTRTGKFQTDASGTIVTDLGYKLLDVNGQPIQIPPDLQGRGLSIAETGQIAVKGDNGPVPIGRINVVLVKNPEANLKDVGDNLYASVNLRVYDPMQAVLSPEDVSQKGSIRQGHLEMSNVDLPQEMTDLIQVQRAYQLNSRSIQTVDAMMGMANNLRS